MGAHGSRGSRACTDARRTEQNGTEQNRTEQNRKGGGGSRFDMSDGRARARACSGMPRDSRCPTEQNTVLPATTTITITTIRTATTAHPTHCHGEKLGRPKKAPQTRPRRRSAAAPVASYIEMRMRMRTRMRTRPRPGPSRHPRGRIPHAP